MKRFVILLIVLAILLFPMGVIGKTTVTVWFAGTPQGFMDVINNELVPRFEAENPGTSLEVTFVPWGELSIKLGTAFAGGVGPDVFMHGGAATAGFAAAGQIVPLDCYLDSWSEAEDFGANLDCGLYRGKRYAVPLFGAGRLLTYRADIFRECGLDPDTPPKTWEELRDYAKKLTKKEHGRILREGIDLPVRGIDAQQIWAGFLWQNGGSFFNEEYTKAAFNSSKGVEALEFLVGLIQKDVVADTRYDVGQSAAPSPLALGRAAMFFAVPEEVNQIKNYSPEVYRNIRVAFPTCREEQVTLYSFSGLFLSKDAQNKEEAWRAIEFFTGRKALAGINESMSTLPPRKSLTNTGFIAKDNNIKMFVEGMQYGRPNPNIAAWTKCRDVLSRYIEKAIFGQITPKEALDRAAEEINRILAE